MRNVMMSVVVGTLALAEIAGAETPTERGVTVYAAQKCAMCHSVAGKGNPKGPLDGIGKKLTTEELRQWIVDAPGMTARTKAPRKPAMKAYALPKEDVEALVAYMASL